MANIVVKRALFYAHVSGFLLLRHLELLKFAPQTNAFASQMFLAFMC